MVCIESALLSSIEFDIVDCFSGGKLAEPQGLSEFKFVADFLAANAERQVVRIGIDDNRKEGKFVFTSSGKNVLYQKFQPGRPIYNKHLNCVVFGFYRGAYRWGDESCGFKRAFLCEALPLLVNKKGHIISQKQKQCAEGFERSGNKCYSLSQSPVHSYFTARNACKALGAKLAEPKSKLILTSQHS